MFKQLKLRLSVNDEMWIVPGIKSSGRRKQWKTKNHYPIVDRNLSHYYNYTIF